MNSAVSVSTMSGKLINIPAINTNTVTNPFCIKMKESDTICGKCYSHKMLNSYRKSCQPAFQRNSDALSKMVLIPDLLPRVNSAYFRFNGHGELINLTHLLNLVAICEKNPHTSFALWTKRKDLISKCFNTYAKPANLILVYSNPKIDCVQNRTPKHFDKIFNNVSRETDGENCTGQKCIDCLACYRNDSGTDVIIERVK